MREQLEHILTALQQENHTVAGTIDEEARTLHIIYGGGREYTLTLSEEPDRAEVMKAVQDAVQVVGT